jgi:hypothetical protein
MAGEGRAGGNPLSRFERARNAGKIAGILAGVLILVQGVMQIFK